jgi:LysM domain-containing protein
MRKTRLVVALLIFGLLLTATALRSEEATKSTSTRPPKNLKKVGDHWTPWDPPTPGPNDYIIVRGDTLWDLAGKWLSNPFLWPQVWDQNRYILDSHWIYPGDTLVVPGKPTVVPPEGPPPGEEAPPEAPPEEAPKPKPRAAPTAPPLVPVADPADLYCSGYIEPSHTAAELRVVAGELEKMVQGQGDVVYLSQGRSQGVEPGDQYTIERVSGGVVHPVTGESLGVYIRRLGRARVLVAQDDRSIAVLELACEDIRPGDELVAWAEIPVPMVPRMGVFDRYDVTPSGGPQGYVVELRDRLSAAGAGYLIHTDLGSGTVKPGEVLTLYRDNGDLPRKMLGRAIVLTVEEGTSTAKIVQAVREVEKGDRVEVGQ